MLDAPAGEVYLRLQFRTKQRTLGTFWKLRHHQRHVTTSSEVVFTSDRLNVGKLDSRQEHTIELYGAAISTRNWSMIDRPSNISVRSTA